MVGFLKAPAERVDVIVIGGGPSGASAATLIAQRGHRVLLCERERFPRFHIGESLIPETFWVLERLGLLEKLRSSAFVQKHSVQFITDQGKLSEPFYFWDHKPHPSSQTWQVLRSEFDTMLLDNAAAQGVEVRQGTRVLEVLFDGERAVGVRVQDDEGEREIAAQVVIDASGMSTLLIDRLNLRDWDNDLKKSAIWTYFRDAQRDAGKDAGATLVMQTQGKAGWFWFIPLHDNRTSIGVVADHDYLLKNRPNRDPQAIFWEEVAKCPGLQPRLAQAEVMAPYRVAKEYSYRARQASGDGWVLVGDAYGFLDPLYSSGVLLALISGARAADAVCDGLDKHDTSAAQLGCWVEEYNRGMGRMKRLVRLFYEGFSFGRFVQRHPDLKGYITDLLIGDLFNEKVDALWAPMDQMQAEMMQGLAAKA